MRRNPEMFFSKISGRNGWKKAAAYVRLSENAKAK